MSVTVRKLDGSLGTIVGVELYDAGTALPRKVIMNSMFLITKECGAAIRFEQGATDIYMEGVEIYAGIHSLPFWRRLKTSWRVFAVLMGFRDFGFQASDAGESK